MKKFSNYFFIVCTILLVQLFSGSNVSAKPIEGKVTDSMAPVEKSKEFAIPKLVKFEQISPNQIQITYDRDVDMKLGTKASNYWIQSTISDTPKGIATLGKNDKVNAKNSLTDNMVKIKPVEGSAKTFILTFNQDIPKGEKYKLIICYVTVKGAPPYNGDNGTALFVGK